MNIPDLDPPSKEKVLTVAEITDVCVSVEEEILNSVRLMIASSAVVELSVSLRRASETVK